MALRIREFPVARGFPEPRETPVAREFLRLKLFPPVSRETGISQEFPAHGFPVEHRCLVATQFCQTSLQLPKPNESVNCSSVEKF